jgi:hypothetical protein
LVIDTNFCLFVAGGLQLAERALTASSEESFALAGPGWGRDRSLVPDSRLCDYCAIGRDPAYGRGSMLPG